MDRYRYATITLLNVNGVVSYTLKAEIENIIIERGKNEIESESGFRRFEPARHKDWNLHLLEDTKRKEETRFCGSYKPHGFHRWEESFWCDGHNAQQCGADYMIQMVTDILHAEHVPNDLIVRIRNRLIFGHPEGDGKHISAERLVKDFPESSDENFRKVFEEHEKEGQNPDE